jgi:hypothetical protein
VALLSRFASTFPGARGGTALAIGEPASQMSGPYNVTVTGPTQVEDFGDGTIEGQWKFTATSPILDPDTLVVWSDTPVGKFNGFFAGTYTFTIQRFDSTKTVGLGLEYSAVVVIPQPAAPDPSVFKRITIFDYYNLRAQVFYVMWAEVPLALQSQFAKPGKVSRWPLASGAENAALAAGEVAEITGTLTRGELSNSAVRAELEARWARFNATINDEEALIEENTFWLGDRWMRL